LKFVAYVLLISLVGQHTDPTLRWLLLIAPGITNVGNVMSELTGQLVTVALNQIHPGPVQQAGGINSYAEVDSDSAVSAQAFPS
jgi:hypothetical protein